MRGREPANAPDGSGEADLLRAAARAATLDDRLAGAKLAPASPGQAAARLARWRGHVAGGAEPEFAAYLAEAGLTRAQAAALMSDVAVPGAAGAPPWVHTLAGITSRARSGGDAGDPAEVPFGQLWTPAAGAARHAVLSALDAGCRGLLAPGALGQVVRDFLTGISQLGAEAAYEVFSGLRRQLRDTGRTGRAYEQFIGQQRAAGLPLLVTRYPVLGRLIAQRTADLAAVTAELLARLRADRAALADTFWPGGDPGLVTSIGFGWGDPHRGGRTVARVAFECGLTLAYKPRPAGAELGLHRLLTATAAAGLAGPLAPRVLARDGYGWAGWIGRRECSGEADLAGYYRRAGALLALAWLLSSADLHAENIIAAGPAPAVIDGEMMSPPRLVPELLSRPDQWSPAEAEAARQLGASVFMTGLLPWWQGTSPDNARDLSGLAGSYPGCQRDWAHRNTADMVPVVEPLPLRATGNAPAPGSIVTLAVGHVDQLLQGYGAADRWLGRRKDLLAELVARSGLLTAEARITLRPTMAYALMLGLAGVPARLTDGLDRSLALDAVSNREWWPPPLARLHARDPAAARRITAAERRALERLDVPLFTASPADRDLVTECGPVTGIFAGTPAADLHARLARLGSGHHREQARLVRATFESHSPAGPGRIAPPARRRQAARRELDLAARQAADLIARRAIHADGTVTWLAVRPDDYTGHPTLGGLGIDLYSGRAGLSVFLAAGAAHWGDGGLAQLARGCAGPIADSVCDGGPDQLGGALSGAASAIYGLALTAELLGDAALARAAGRAASHIAARTAHRSAPGPAAPRTAGAGDVSGGLLGAALALAAAAGHGAGAAASTAAGALARQALTEDLAAGPRAKGGDPGLRTGIAHGLTGTALALSLAGAAAGDSSLTAAAGPVLGAADAALARAEAGAGAGCDGGPLARRWCRGSTGVACAALAMAGLCATAAWQRRVREAVRGAHRGELLPEASACCGHSGVLELLILAGHQRAAQSQAGTLIPAAGRGWALGRQPGVAPLLPGFHQGLAGLGYTFLRALSPDRFPSVLTWA